jgi:hypothetical protein
MHMYLLQSTCVGDLEWIGIELNLIPL